MGLVETLTALFLGVFGIVQLSLLGMFILDVLARRGRNRSRVARELDLPDALTRG